MKELLIDTCNQTLSIALVCDNKLVACEKLAGFKNHAETVMVVIVELVRQVKWQPQDLEQIGIAIGPGSYTGVRIGVTVAKTLGYALQIPVKCVSSLELLAYTALDIPNTLVVPMIDARRQCVYAGVYQYQNGQLQVVSDDKYQKIEDLKEYLNQQKQELILVGDYNNFLWDTEYISGSQSADATNIVYAKGKVYSAEDVHAIVPNYLKKVEAEEKWQNNHHKIVQKDSYIRVTKNDN